MNVNLRPYYAEGSKTLAFETAEQLGWELPDRVVAPIASGSLFTKVARGFQEFIDAGLVTGELPAFNGAQALGCSPVATAFAAGHRHLPPGQARHDRQVAGDRQPGRRPVRGRAGAAGPTAAIDSVTDDEIRAGIRLLAETTGIFTETAGGVTTAVLAKLAERGDIGPDERVVAYITGDGLKTLDTVRGTFEVTEIAPSIDEFDAAFAPAGGGGLMAVTVKLPTQLRDAAGGAAATEVEGGTVGEALEALYAEHGELRGRLSDDGGGLRRFVNVYIGGEDIRFLDGLETPVSDGDELTILPAVAASPPAARAARSRRRPPGRAPAPGQGWRRAPPCSPTRSARRRRRSRPASSLWQRSSSSMSSRAQRHLQPRHAVRAAQVDDAPRRSSCASQRIGCRYADPQLGQVVSLATTANVHGAFGRT